jgi:general secretion pathway protein E
MEVEPFLISSTLLGVLAQRLVRKLCPECKKRTFLSPHIAHELNVPYSGNYYKAVGCPACDFTGYKGRQAVGELFVLNDKVKEMMKNGVNDYQIREMMRQSGMRTIADELKQMLIDGEISYEEAIRVGLMDN